jgi:hypothetical protein
MLVAKTKSVMVNESGDWIIARGIDEISKIHIGFTVIENTWHQALVL